jgi:hypothetical protein
VSSVCILSDGGEATSGVSPKFTSTNWLPAELNACCPPRGNAGVPSHGYDDGVAKVQVRNREREDLAERSGRCHPWDGSLDVALASAERARC